MLTRKKLFFLFLALALSLLALGHKSQALSAEAEVQEKLDSLYVRLLAIKEVQDFDETPLGEAWWKEAETLLPDSETLLALGAEYALSGGSENARTRACKKAYLEGGTYDPATFTPPTPTSLPKLLPPATRGGAWTWAKDFVRERLESPSTANFPWTDFQISNPNSGRVWYVKSYVDADNAFGATVRTKFLAKLEYLGNDRWKLLGLQFE